MISSWDIEQAEKIINKPADGSKANQARRLRAAKLLKGQAAALLAFAFKDSKSKAYQPCVDECSRLCEIAERA